MVFETTELNILEVSLEIDTHITNNGLLWTNHNRQQTDGKMIFVQLYQRVNTFIVTSRTFDILFQLNKYRSYENRSTFKERRRLEHDGSVNETVRGV